MTNKAKRKSARLQHEFTCARCGTDVYKRRGNLDHNHCPVCHWSIHRMFGYADAPPCGELMEPSAAGTVDGDPVIRVACTGCGYAMKLQKRYEPSPDARLCTYFFDPVHCADFLDPDRNPRGAAMSRPLTTVRTLTRASFRPPETSTFGLSTNSGLMSARLTPFLRGCRRCRPYSEPVR
jgi:hypothetical protein